MTPQERYELAITELRAQLALVASHVSMDASARLAYDQQITVMAREFRDLATSGRISWEEAAMRANETRNTILEMMRGRSTPLGRSIAEYLKMEGRTLNSLIARKTTELFGPHAVFTRLSVQDKNMVFFEIVKSAGKSDARITTAMRRLSPAGRSLVVLSLGISIYNIAVAENRMAAAGHEVTITGAGILGGMAGGAMAGLACGPGAPVCVAVGTFAGGAMAALGADYFW